MLAAIAGVAIMLDGADSWAERRQRLASAFGARFHMIAVAKAATVPFRILAIGAIPLSLPRGGVDVPALRGPLPACNPPTRAVAVTQRIALLFALAPQLPGLRSGGVARWHSACSPSHVPPTSSFCCRSRRIGSGANEFGGPNRGSPVSREPGNAGLGEPITPDPGSASERLVQGENIVHIPDVIDTEEYRSGGGLLVEAC
jgi:hypothetical protein